MSAATPPTADSPPRAATRPIVVGEVLFDLFPDGREVLGGAPFNVAWNLRGLGFDPLLITRVGRDERGKKIIGSMERWGLDTSGVQVDPALPTGVVQVSVEAGQPSFEIVPHQAYDAIDAAQAGKAVRDVEAAALIRGSLCDRSGASRTAIGWLQRALDAPVLIDVNLRAPWWDARRLREALSNATVAKLNDEELALLVDERHGLRVEAGSRGAGAHALRDDHDLETVVVTCGAEGALVVGADGEHRVEAVPPRRFVDAVGAGDAFMSMVVAGRLERWAAQATLERASRFASEICALQGATHDDRELYERTRCAAREGAHG